MKKLTIRSNEVKNVYMKIVENIIESKDFSELYSDYNKAFSKLKKYVNSPYYSYTPIKIKELQNIINDIINCTKKLEERELNETNDPSISEKYDLVAEIYFEQDEKIKVDSNIKSLFEELRNLLNKIKNIFFKIDFLSEDVFSDEKDMLDDFQLGSISLALILEIEGICKNIQKSYELHNSYILLEDISLISKMIELFNELKHKLIDVKYCNSDFYTWLDLLNSVYDCIKQILETKISCKDEEGYYLEENSSIKVSNAKTIKDIAIPIYDWVYTN